MMVVRQEHVTFLDTETHSRFEIDIVVEQPPRDSFIKFRRGDCVHTPQKNRVYRFPARCLYAIASRSRISRGRKGNVGMRPEGIIVDFIGNVPGTVISLTSA